MSTATTARPALDVRNAVLLREVLEALPEGQSISRDAAGALMGLDMSTDRGNTEFHDAKTTLVAILAAESAPYTVSGRSFRSGANEGWCYRLTSDMNDPFAIRNTVTRFLTDITRARTGLSRFESFRAGTHGGSHLGRNVRELEKQLRRVSEDAEELFARHAELADTSKSKDVAISEVLTNTSGVIPYVETRTAI